jgi:hypothetical protein
MCVIAQCLAFAQGKTEHRRAVVVNVFSGTVTFPGVRIGMAMPSFITASTSERCGGCGSGAAGVITKASFAMPDVGTLLRHPAMRLALVPISILHTGVTAAPRTSLASVSRVPEPPVFVGKAFILGQERLAAQDDGVEPRAVVGCKLIAPGGTKSCGRDGALRQLSLAQRRCLEAPFHLKVGFVLGCCSSYRESDDDPRPVAHHVT